MGWEFAFYPHELNTVRWAEETGGQLASCAWGGGVRGEEAERSTDRAHADDFLQRKT